MATKVFLGVRLSGTVGDYRLHQVRTLCEAHIRVDGLRGWRMSITGPSEQLHHLADVSIARRLECEKKDLRGRSSPPRLTHLFSQNPDNSRCWNLTSYSSGQDRLHLPRSIARMPVCETQPPTIEPACPIRTDPWVCVNEDRPSSRRVDSTAFWETLGCWLADQAHRHRASRAVHGKVSFKVHAQQSTAVPPSSKCVFGSQDARIMRCHWPDPRLLCRSPGLATSILVVHSPWFC